MDIRQLYASLSEADKALYQQIRTEMRKIYLRAHTNIVGMDNWNNHDDAYMDLIDIKLASLFDRAGAIEGVKSPINKEEEKSIESKIEDNGKAVTIKMNTEMSEASQKLAASKANGVIAW